MCLERKNYRAGAHSFHRDPHASRGHRSRRELLGVEGHWGLEQCSVGETMRDPTAKAPHVSGHYVTFTIDATLGRRGEPNNDKNKMHRGLKVVLKEISIKSHLVLT